MEGKKNKSLGHAIDALVNALEDLDESTRLVAVRAACEHLNIALLSERTLASTSLPQATVPQTQSSAPVESLEGEIVDIRSLKERKSPSNAMEMACVVAYYLENHAPGDERRSELARKDVETYFKQGGFPLPKAPGQVLIDAKDAGYLDSPSRGKYKLNPVGYNLVAHSLPRSKGE